MVVVRIAFSRSLSFSLSSALLLLLRYVHGHRFMGVVAYICTQKGKKKRREERKRRKKIRRTSDSGGGSSEKKKEKE